jgi:hypothetical protein
MLGEYYRVVRQCSLSAPPTSPMRLRRHQALTIGIAHARVTDLMDHVLQNLANHYCGNDVSIVLHSPTHKLSAQTYPHPPQLPYPRPRRFSREGRGARDRLACVGRRDCGAGVNPRGTADSLQEIGRLRGGSNDPVPRGQVPTHPLAAMRGSKVSRAQTAPCKACPRVYGTPMAL